MIVKEINPYEFEIDWDPNDPLESIMNEWTEADFIRAIKDQLNLIMNSPEADNM